MSIDREALQKDLSQLPLLILAAVTVRAALRYLPIAAMRLKNSGARPSTLGTSPKDADEAPVIFGMFHACQFAAFTSWLASISIDKVPIYAAIGTNNPDHAADVTFASVILASQAMGMDPAIFAIAKATAASSGGATTAAMTAARVKTPGTVAGALVNGASAALGVAEDAANAIELASEVASLRLATCRSAPGKSENARLSEGAVRLLSAPLWESGMPEKTWYELRKKLHELDAGFEVWIEWYEKRLQGTRPNLRTEKKCVTLSKAWFILDAADTNDYLQSLVDGGPVRGPPAALLAAARSRDERIPGLGKIIDKPDSGQTVYSIWPSFRSMGKATVEQFRPLALLSLFLASFGCISLLSKIFGIPIYGQAFVKTLLAYEWSGTRIFAPIATLIGLFGIAPPPWYKDVFFVYYRITSSVWRALSTFSSERADRPWLLRTKDWPRLIAISLASLFWPFHFIAFWRHWLRPVDVYYNTNPPVFEVLEIGDINGSSNRIMLALFIPHFTVNILMIVFFTTLYFAINASLAPL